MKLQELGITSDIFRELYGNADENHDSINGTYRIIFHRLQKQSNALERDDTYEKRTKDEQRPSWIRSMSYTPGVDTRKYSKNAHVQNATVCTIL